MSSIDYASNASKLHKSFGLMLIEAGLAESFIRQEVPVKELCPSFSSGRERFDYYIPVYNCVVELHGEQHFTPVKFGGVSDNKAEQNFLKRVKVDQEKAIAARNVGLLYVMFRFDEDITLNTFNQRLEEERLWQAENYTEPEIIIDEEAIARKKRINDNNKEYYKTLREKNKERDKAYRKEAYARAKAQREEAAKSREWTFD